MRTPRLSRRLPAVRLGYVTECIDREGLERRRTGTRQGKIVMLSGAGATITMGD